MTKDNLTNEQKANLDYLSDFYSSGNLIHIKLNRTDHLGRNIFLNGELITKLTDTLFIIKERVLGEIRVSLFEIKDNGISEMRVEVSD